MNTLERESSLGELILSPRDVMTAHNAPFVLTRGRQRKSSVVVRYTRVERWDVVDDARTVWKRRALFAVTALGGVGVGALAVMAFSGPSSTVTKADDTSVALSVPAAQVPSAATPIAPAMTRVRVAEMPRAAVARPVVATSVVAAAATPVAAIERTGPVNESAALAQAFSSNESVSWRGATTTGTVVVGAAQIENGKYCRDVAILTRADNAADRTVNSRKCLEPGGRIADRAPPTPQ
ncbi:MAG: hypothetical protein ABI898_04400 [Sphingomonadales bacterium]